MEVNAAASTRLAKTVVVCATHEAIVYGQNRYAAATYVTPDQREEDVKSKDEASDEYWLTLLFWIKSC